MTSFQESVDFKFLLEVDESDLPFPASLENELRRWNVLWCSKKQELDSVYSYTLLPDETCDKDSNIHCLLVIAYNMPNSSVEAVRSFSQIKTHLRSALSKEYLSLTFLFFPYIMVDGYQRMKFVNPLFKHIQEIFSNFHCFNNKFLKEDFLTLHCFS